MKNNFIALVIVILIIVVGAFFFFMEGREDTSEELTDLEILPVLEPRIMEYCGLLDEQATHSACPTCKFYYPDDFYRNFISANYVPEGGASSRPHVLTKTKSDGSYDVEVEMQLIYGYNTHPGKVNLTFQLDEAGAILSEDLPLEPCIS